MRIINASSPRFAVSGVLPAPSAAGCWGQTLATDTWDAYRGQTHAGDDRGQTLWTLGERQASNFFGLDSESRRRCGCVYWPQARGQTLGVVMPRSLGLSSAFISEFKSWLGHPVDRHLGTEARREGRHLGTDTWNEERVQTLFYPLASIQVLEFFTFLQVYPRKLLQCRKTIVQSAANVSELPMGFGGVFCCSHVCQ